MAIRDMIIDVYKRQVTAYLIGNMGANWLMPILADGFGWFWSYIVVAALSAFSAVGYLILAKREEEIIKD